MSAVSSILPDNFPRLTGTFEGRVKHWAALRCAAWVGLVSHHRPLRFVGARRSPAAAASRHGDNLAGTKDVARAAGQREEYIDKALHDYKSSHRTGSGVAAVANMAYPLIEKGDLGALPISRGSERAASARSGERHWHLWGSLYRRKRRTAMDRRWILAGGGLLLLGLVGVAVVTAEPSQGPAFIAGDQPVSEDQVRQKLQSDGWSNVQIVREGRYLEAMGSKNGETTKVAVDAQTGRLRAAEED